jgi:hypothetical protein
MAGSVSAVATTEQPIWERVITYTFAAGDTAEVKMTLPLNGILQKIICKPAAKTGTARTVTLAIDDNADHEIFTAASLAEDTLYQYSVSEPLSGIIDVGILPSGDPVAAWTISVILRGI